MIAIDICEYWKFIIGQCKTNDSKVKIIDTDRAEFVEDKYIISGKPFEELKKVQNIHDEELIDAGFYVVDHNLFLRKEVPFKLKYDASGNFNYIIEVKNFEFYIDVSENTMAKFEFINAGMAVYMGAKRMGKSFMECALKHVEDAENN